MPLSLTESTLRVHNLGNDIENFEAGVPELHRVETWITSHASLKGMGPPSTRSRATSVSSASSIAVTLATVCTNGSRVSRGFISSGGLEEEDENCEYPSQDRDVLGKAGSQDGRGTWANSHLRHLHTNRIFLLVQELKSPLAFPVLLRSPALKKAVVSAGQRTPIADVPSQVNEGITSGNMVVL